MALDMVWLVLAAVLASSVICLLDGLLFWPCMLTVLPAVAAVLLIWGFTYCQAYTAVNWVLTDTALDVETELALSFLDYLMLGTAAAPLRKALNDSGLGAAIVGGGMDDELKQPIFSVGLKVR
jgi:hypothetical protein